LLVGDVVVLELALACLCLCIESVFESSNTMGILFPIEPTDYFFLFNK